MKTITQFLIHYGYWVLFANVAAEQVGLPLPAVPVLLAMGALAGLGYYSMALSFFVVLVACVAADYLWFEIGRTRGISVLRTLCRLSLEPDSCVSNSQASFEAQGARVLLIAKFVPGLSTMAPPMAGLSEMGRVTFLLLDAAGSALWAGSFLFAGYLFRNQLERIAELAGRFGSGAGTLLFLLLASYLGFKWVQRQRFLRLLRVARITPEELYQQLQDGCQVVIIDLRSAPEQSQGNKLPGALLFNREALATRHQEIPRDRDVILYCT